MIYRSSYVNGHGTWDVEVRDGEGFRNDKRHGVPAQADAEWSEGVNFRIEGKPGEVHLTTGWATTRDALGIHAPLTPAQALELAAKLIEAAAVGMAEADAGMAEAVEWSDDPNPEVRASMMAIAGDRA